MKIKSITISIENYEFGFKKNNNQPTKIKDRQATKLPRRSKHKKKFKLKTNEYNYKKNLKLNQIRNNNSTN